MDHPLDNFFPYDHQSSLFWLFSPLFPWKSKSRSNLFMFESCNTNRNICNNVIDHYYVILHNKRNTFSHYSKKNYLNHGSVHVDKPNWTRKIVCMNQTVLIMVNRSLFQFCYSTVLSAIALLFVYHNSLHYSHYLITPTEPNCVLFIQNRTEMFCGSVQFFLVMFY
jgi:hypothetical protein